MIWNKCDNQQLWKYYEDVKGVLFASHVSTSIMHFKVNLKRFLIKLLVQLSADFFFSSLFSTKFKACDKTSMITNTKWKSEWIKDVPEILSPIQVASE